MAIICVFCSAEDNLPEICIKEARETGRLIGIRGHDFAYGGGNIGLMKEVAISAKAHGAKITGIVPERWKHLEKLEDKRLIAKDFRHRKILYQMNSDAIIALPGGFGTLDEIADTFVCIQHNVHQKPFALINTNNFYQYLKQHIDKSYSEGYIDPKHRTKYTFVNTPLEAMDYIEEQLAKLKQQQ